MVRYFIPVLEHFLYTSCLLLVLGHFDVKLFGTSFIVLLLYQTKSRSNALTSYSLS
jgi:hypothetical protein